MPRKFLPDSKVCDRYHVCSSTLYRWDRDPELKFPKPIRINGRKYRDEAELDAFDEGCSSGTAAASQNDCGA